jgi:hypothetical protein
MRPLSDLQKTVLLTAYTSHRARPKYDIDTSLSEILIKVYGFPCRFDITRNDNPSQIFDRKEIGIGRYQSCYAVVSKCFGGLVFRKLAKKAHGQGFTCGYGRGIKLTNAGVRVAEGIRRDRFKNRR